MCIRSEKTVRKTDPGVAEPRPGNTDFGVAESLDDDATAAEATMVALEHPLDDDARGVLSRRQLQPMS